MKKYLRRLKRTIDVSILKYSLDITLLIRYIDKIFRLVHYRGERGRDYISERNIRFHNNFSKLKLLSLYNEEDLYRQRGVAISLPKPTKWVLQIPPSSLSNFPLSHSGKQYIGGRLNISKDQGNTCELFREAKRQRAQDKFDVKISFISLRQWIKIFVGNISTERALCEVDLLLFSDATFRRKFTSE